MSCYDWPRKNNFLCAFEIDGSRDIYTLKNRMSADIVHSLFVERNLIKAYGSYYMFDQEPVDLTVYKGINGTKYTIQNHEFYSAHLNHLEQFRMHISSIYSPIICHSERNSIDLNTLKTYNVLDVHYWWHGLVSRDWFRHWRHYQPIVGDRKRFGTYIRDTSGTRRYRSDLLEFVKEQQSIYCPILNNQTVSSNESARINWNDTSQFEIQIVAETLFQTKKTYLTEKVFKPIVMEQPFILFAGPHSLKYMQEYGFQTFSSCWDESYDTIENSSERYQALIEVIKSLNAMPSKEFKRILQRAKIIAINNKEHFFSNKFETQMLNELHKNFNQAFETQQELFFTNPGGDWFNLLNKLYQRSGQLGKYNRERIDATIKHINSQHPLVAKQIVKQYPDLF
jgi:hypothetical protein